ncbi:MAG TPA: uroporphyrinogen-III synthase [Gammaproteobacteria bacterium]
MSAASRTHRILLTRAEEDSAAWAEALQRRGHAAVVLPCIAAEPLESPALAAVLRDASSRADWLVFTSRRGVECFARLVPDRAAGARIAVVGPATAEAARRLLGRADLVGRGTAKALVPELQDALFGPAASPARNDASTAPTARHAPHDACPAPSSRGAPRVVLALAANAGDVIERELRSAGAECRRFDVYRTVPVPPREPRRPLAAFRVDAVFLASPSAVEGFVNQVEVDGSARLVAIGPSTSEAARARGLAVAAEAREPSLEGLLEAIE